MILLSVENAAVIDEEQEWRDTSRTRQKNDSMMFASVMSIG